MKVFCIHRCHHRIIAFTVWTFASFQILSNTFNSFVSRHLQLSSFVFFNRYSRTVCVVCGVFSVVGEERANTRASALTWHFLSLRLVTQRNCALLGVWPVILLSIEHRYPRQFCLCEEVTELEENFSVSMGQCRIYRTDANSEQYRGVLGCVCYKCDLIVLWPQQSSIYCKTISSHILLQSSCYLYSALLYLTALQ